MLYKKKKVYVNFFKFGGGSHHIPSPTRPAISLFLVTLDQLESYKKKKIPKGSNEFFDIKLNRYLYKY